MESLKGAADGKLKESKKTDGTATCRTVFFDAIPGLVEMLNGSGCMLLEFVQEI